jgi:hypothetical protein
LLHEESSLDEGAEIRLDQLATEAIERIEVRACLWANAVGWQIDADRKTGDRTAALAFGTDLTDDMDDAAMFELAQRGQAVSPVTSYLAIEPGVRPSTDGFVEEGGSGSGYGRGAGGFRGRDAKVPQIRSGNADVRGSLSKEVIRRVIRQHINEVRACYEQQLNARPDLQGRVSIKFVVAPTGAVQQAAMESSELHHPKAEQCIAQAVRRWIFPAPENGGLVIVSYPFVLSQTGN